MIIRRIVLSNFRRFRKLELSDLPDGLTGIIGKNGAGKSTILEAVGWALYGTYALDRTNKEGVRSQGVPGDENCEVELEFEMGGDSYKVLRRLQGKRALAQAWVYKNGSKEAVAEREEGVNPYIAKLFGMDRQTFFVSVYARQKELALLTDQNPGERQKIIRRLLRIDLIDTALQDIRRDSREKQDMAENLKGMLLDDSTVKSEIAGLEVRRKALEAEKKKNEKKTEEIKSVLKAATEAKRGMDEKRKIFQKVHIALTRIDKEIQGKVDLQEKRSDELAALEAEKKEFIKLIPKDDEYIKVVKVLEKLESVRGLFEEKKNLEKNLVEHTDARSKVLLGKKRLMDLLAGFKGLGAEKEKTQLQLKKEKTCLSQITKEMSTLQARIQAGHEAVSQWEEKKKNIKNLGPKSKCPECSQDLGESYEHILGHFGEEIEKQGKVIKTLIAKEKEQQAEVDTLGSSSEKLESCLEDIREKEKEESGFKSKLEDHEKSLQGLEKSILMKKARVTEIGTLEFSEDQYEALKKEKKELTKTHEKVMELKTKTARIPSLAGELKELVVQLSDLGKQKSVAAKEQEGTGFSEKNLTAVGQECDAAQEKMHQNEKMAAETRHQIEKIKIQITQKEQELAKQKELRGKAESAVADAKRLAVLAETMDKFRQDLASRIRPMLATRTSQLVAKITGGRYVAVDFDEEYNVFVYDGTERFPIERFSGGEQDLVNLCLRIAISQIISEQNNRTGINFIALDEIFGSQDAGRKESILRALNDLSGQFRQIFLITHHEDLKDTMQHVLAVDEAEEGVSHAAFVA